jgi:hypothetical protein
MTERDFKVKKGLTVENGDLEFKAASSVIMKDGSTTGLVVKEGSNSFLTFDTTNEKIVLGKKLEAGSVEIEGGAFDINGGAIDNAVIGADTPAGAKFTTIETTQQVKINGSARETNSALQVNGGSDYVEARLFTDIQNDQIDSTTVAKLGNMLVLDNEEDVPGTGQGVMFTVGAHDGNGDQFGIGRVIQGSSSNPLFGIGFSDNAFDKSTATTAALLPTKLMLKFDSSGNATLEKNGAYLAFTGAESGGTEREIRFAASSNGITAGADRTYTLPVDFPSSSSKILQSTTSGALSWVSQGGGTADSVDATNINNASGAVNLVSTDGDVLVEAQAADHKVTIKGDHESDVAIHLDGDAAAASIVDIDAGVLDIDASGSINIATTGAAGDIAIVSAHTSGVAFHLDANANAASEVQIDAGILDVDVTGAATIDSGGAMSLTGAGVSIMAGSGELDLTTNGALDINAAATTIDVGSSLSPATLSIDSTDTTNLTLTANDSNDKILTIEASNSGSGDGRVSIQADGIIYIGTATSGVPVQIGHGTSEVTFGDNVTITGNLTVNGDQTVINTTAIVAEDKSMLLGIAGGMEDATYARSSSTVTVTSASHGFANGESIFVSNMGNSITDGVYTVSSVSTNTFVLDSHGTSGTVGAGATMQHSSADTTEATADGSGIFVPGTSLHSIQYDSSHGFQVSDDLDLANGKHLSINGTTVLNATTLGSGVVSSSLTSVGTLTTLTVDNVLINGSNIGHTGDTDLITVASGIVTVAGEISVTTLDIGGTDVSSNAGELNLVDGSSAGSIVNSKAVIYSSAGQVNGTTLGVNSVSVMEVNSSDSAGSSSGAAITLFNMNKTVYRAAKIAWSVELLTTGAASTAQFEMGETLVQWRSGSDVQLTTYGYMSTTTDLATITAAVSGDNVVVKYDPVGTSTENYKFRAVATQLVL